MSEEVDNEYGGFESRRTRRIRIVAWVVIAALILAGGGSTLLTLLIG